MKELTLDELRQKFRITEQSTLGEKNLVDKNKYDIVYNQLKKQNALTILGETGSFVINHDEESYHIKKREGTKHWQGKPTKDVIIDILREATDPALKRSEFQATYTKPALDKAREEKLVTPEWVEKLNSTTYKITQKGLKHLEEYENKEVNPDEK